MTRPTRQSGAYLTLTRNGLVRGCRTCKAPLERDLSCPRCGVHTVATCKTDWAEQRDDKACRDCGYVMCAASCKTYWRKECEKTDAVPEGWTLDERLGNDRHWPSYTHGATGQMAFVLNGDTTRWAASGIPCGGNHGYIATRAEAMAAALGFEIECVRLGAPRGYEDCIHDVYKWRRGDDVGEALHDTAELAAQWALKFDAKQAVVRAIRVNLDLQPACPACGVRGLHACKSNDFFSTQNRDRAALDRMRQQTAYLADSVKLWQDNRALADLAFGVAAPQCSVCCSTGPCIPECDADELPDERVAALAEERAGARTVFGRTSAELYQRFCELAKADNR